MGQAVGGKRTPYNKGNIDWIGAGKKLKARSGWKDNGNGTDDYGFSALPGGTRDTDGAFSFAGDYGIWWTTTESSSGRAYYRGILYDYDNVNENDYYKDDAFSVRCVGD